MKRTVPLFITAACGIVLILSFFSPFTETWGETAAIWFDILAAIAMILGGGNLLKTHIKKLSDRPAGWGYSIFTLVAFLAMLFVGLTKWGTPPATVPEKQGYSFASLPIEQFPRLYFVEGQLPRDDHKKPVEVPSSCKKQLTEVDGHLCFLGWMTGDQKSDLLELQDRLQWKCTVQRLHNEAQPPKKFNDLLGYDIDHQVLTYRGWISEAGTIKGYSGEIVTQKDITNWGEKALNETKVAIASLNNELSKSKETEGDLSSFACLKNFLADDKEKINPRQMTWKRAAAKLIQLSVVSTGREIKSLPPGLASYAPKTREERIAILQGETEGSDPLVNKLRTIGQGLMFGHASNLLMIQGPMSPEERDELVNQFPLSRPLSESQRNRLVNRLDEYGAVNTQPPSVLGKAQKAAMNKTLDRAWTVDSLQKILDSAGVAVPEEKTYCAMYSEQKEGIQEINPKKPAGESVALNEEQVAALANFAEDDTINGEQLLANLKKAGDFSKAQAKALEGFLRDTPSRGKQFFDLFVNMSRAGTLNTAQENFLLAEYRHQQQWRGEVGQLFVESNPPKYVWSGEYNAQGTPFWWLYEYLFKPLTATMFATLAFYVASAAFRAFRAKNFEAFLLLGTAFIFLLGQTYAGFIATGWLPESLAWLKTSNLSFVIMSVFNTAGNRAIMIGIALGIASTSLKVILGIDRSYLGS